jgi:hypothetical protein
MRSSSPPPFPSARHGLSVVLAVAALLSLATVARVPHDGLHPVALLRGFLPLQLAALVWGLARMR